MMAEENSGKLGAGHMAAMARQGLAELRAALYPESNIAQPTEYGMAGRPTPQEIVGDIRDGAASETPTASVIEQRLEGSARDPEPEPPQPERE
jgi:hypothetical protein